MHVFVMINNVKADKCRCECKYLIDKGRCSNGFIWHLYGIQCHKSCSFGENLDYTNFKCKKRLIDILVLPCKDEVLNITETSLVDKRATCKKKKIIALFKLFH